MSKSQIDWAKLGGMAGVMSLVLFGGGAWIGHSVDVWRAPQRQIADEQRQSMFEDECRTNFEQITQNLEQIHNDEADLKRQLITLNNQVRTKQ